MHSIGKWVILPLMFLFGCGQQSEKPPADVIPKDDLVTVMIDMYLADAQAQSMITTDIEEAANVLPYYKHVLEKHDVTLEQFNTSIRYYGRDKNDLYAIYEEVLDSLNVRLSNLK